MAKKKTDVKKAHENNNNVTHMECLGSFLILRTAYYQLVSNLKNEVSNRGLIKKYKLALLISNYANHFHPTVQKSG